MDSSSKCIRFSVGDSIKAIVMCAGRGERLMPLTEDKPKCMVRIKGKPIIHWILDALKWCNLKDIIIITGYKCGTLKSYIKFNITDMDIEFVHQKKLTGTADAIYLVKDLIKEPFIVLAGDTIYEVNDLMKLRQLSNSLLYVKMNGELFQYGTLETINNHIERINEKCTNPTSNLVNCSAYHFSPTVFNFIKKTDIDVRFGERIITNTINLMIDKGVRFTGIRINNFCEITRPEDIEEVEARVSKKKL